jgi:hypothetical protein
MMEGVTWYEVMVTVGSLFAAPAARGRAERRRARPTPRSTILFIVRHLFPGGTHPVSLTGPVSSP